MKRFLLIVLTALLASIAVKAKEAYAVYTSNGTLTFYYDNQKSSRSGTKYSLNTGHNRPEWYYEDITKVVFTSSFSGARPTSTYSWFHDHYPSKISSIVGIEYLNTSEVTDMSRMFYQCTALTSIDVSRFNTSKVTDMSWMFTSCNSLTSLDVSHFNTSKVTDMSSMFDMFNNGNLKSLDVSNFDTGKVTSMNCMFQNCSGLTSLDVSNFNTSRVTDMWSMFSNCDGLTKLDVSHFDTSNVTNFGRMFNNCSNLASLDVSQFNTSKATNTAGMFFGCSSLISLDVSHFETSKVNHMGGMFGSCSSLKSLDLSNFVTSSVEIMEGLFSGCNSLTTIYVGTGWNTNKVSSSYSMFYNCTNLVGGAGTRYDANHVDVAYAHIDGGTSNPGYLTDKNAPAEKEAYAVYTDDGTLTFYYDKLKSSRNGAKYGLNTETNNPGWYTDHRKDIKKVVFNSSFAEARPTSTYHWFLVHSNLSEIQGIKYLNTSEVTDMSDMFYGCSSLKSLDLSGFKTDKVTSMSRMFWDCSSLTSLNLNGLRTDKVTSMTSMFFGCSVLTSLDLSGFKTDNVTSMASMFFGCKGLTSLDLSGFKTDKVTNMQQMFDSCISLTTLDLSSFETDKVTRMDWMFSGCKGLTSLDLSGFKTDNVTATGHMFYGCTDLTSLDMSNFVTHNVTYMGSMFSNCSSLTTIYVGDKWNTEKVTGSDNMFYSCTNLVGGAGTKYDANHVDASYAHIDGGHNNPGYFTDIKDKKVSNEVDLQDLLDGIDESSGTEEHPFIVSVASSGMTVGGNVDIDKEVHLLFDGGTGEPLSIDFVGGVISVNNKNSSLAFNNVVMKNSTMARGQDIATATVGSGGIVNSGKLLLTGCTVADGLITNSGSVYIDGATAVSGITNRVGGRIYITSRMAKTVSISISENDIETATPFILGGKGYTLTAEDAAHISITLPAAYEWKYDAYTCGIVISKKGDSNDDNVIDVADIATIISYMAGEAIAEGMKNVDVNGDGVVDVADIAAVISIMARE